MEDDLNGSQFASASDAVQQAEDTDQDDKDSVSEVNVPVLRKQRPVPKRPIEKQRPREDEPYFKFSDLVADPKATKKNRNKCDACGYGGLIYCCDGCPSSYHAECHVPKVQVNESEPFYCRPCHFAKRFVAQPELKRFKSRNIENEEVAHFFHDLTALMLTARRQHFSLPKAVAELATKVPKIWPNEELPNTRKKRPDQDNNCYVCDKPVFFPDYNKCHFCPIVVHLDCQAEPCAARRIYAWRCPCHVENFVDTYVLDSTSAVRRAKLYRQYASPNPELDTEQVLLDCALKLARESQTAVTTTTMEAAQLLVDFKNYKARLKSTEPTTSGSCPP